MRKPVAFLEDPTDFSLVQGGPLFQLLLRVGLVRPSMDLATRRIVVLVAIMWLPLLILTLLSGQAVGGPGVPFLLDIGTHTRFLLCVPLLIGAEVIVHQRIKGVVRQFFDRGIIASPDRTRFEEAVSAAMRLRNSISAELLLLAISVAIGLAFGVRYDIRSTSSWMSVMSDGQSQITAAGQWNVIVSLTVFRFLLLRWYFRLLVWCYFLLRVSWGIPLQLNAMHPDRAGGLGFLAGCVFAFSPVLFAQTVALSGAIGGKIWHDGATLPQFKLEIAVWLVILILMVLTPLFFFMTQLAAARRAGLREYGIVASRYVAEFRSKWIEGQADGREPLIGSADIQSLADLANSYDVVRETSLVPFGRTLVIRLIILTGLPLLPLTLTMIPIEQLIDRAVGILF